MSHATRIVSLTHGRPNGQPTSQHLLSDCTWGFDAAVQHAGRRRKMRMGGGSRTRCRIRTPPVCRGGVPPCPIRRCDCQARPFRAGRVQPTYADSFRGTIIGAWHASRSHTTDRFTIHPTIRHPIQARLSRRYMRPCALQMAAHPCPQGSRRARLGRRPAGGIAPTAADGHVLTPACPAAS